MLREPLVRHLVVSRSSIKDGPKGTRRGARSSLRRLVIVQLRFAEGLTGSDSYAACISSPSRIQELWETALPPTCSLQFE